MADRQKHRSAPRRKRLAGLEATMVSSLYKSFEVTDLEKLKTADYFDWYCLYDNTIYVYLNGTEIFVDDGKLRLNRTGMVE